MFMFTKTNDFGRVQVCSNLDELIRKHQATNRSVKAEESKSVVKDMYNVGVQYAINFEKKLKIGPTAVNAG